MFYELKPMILKPLSAILGIFPILSALRKMNANSIHSRLCNESTIGIMEFFIPNNLPFGPFSPSQKHLGYGRLCKKDS